MYRLGEGLRYVPAQRAMACKHVSHTRGEEGFAAGESVVPDKAYDYHGPAAVPHNFFAFNGTWTDHSEEATAGTQASAR